MSIRLEPPGAMVKLNSVTLAAPAVSIDFQNIPPTFRHLHLIAMLRSDVAGASESAFMALNGDAVDANYDLQTVQGAAAAASAAQVSGAAFARAFGVVAGATAQASAFTSHVIDIAGYADPAKLKIVDTLTSLFALRAAGNYSVQYRAMLWANAAAINRITLAPSGGPNFVAGSFADLYGVL